MKMRWKAVWLATTLITVIRAQVLNIINLDDTTSNLDQRGLVDEMDDHKDKMDNTLVIPPTSEKNNIQTTIANEISHTYYNTKATNDNHYATDSIENIPESYEIKTYADIEETPPASNETNIPKSAYETTDSNNVNGDKKEPISKEILARSEPDPDELLVETEHGIVRGHKWKSSQDIVSYLDIPYGKFNLSFDAPSKPDSWEDVLEVKEHNKRCPQFIDDKYVGEKDCLTLSVFTRQNLFNASVLFYIHESKFKTGSGDPSIYGPEYLVPKNVILVLPNYRLGPLGFLCLRNDIVQGNAALKDLALALEWTQKNILAFGGNPSNIVVSGDGSSGALAGYLAISPMSKSYVSKVITDSGSLLAHWAVDRNPVLNAEKIAESIRNNSDGVDYNDNFYGSMGIEELITVTKDSHFRPCLENNVEGSFITTTPWKTLQNEKIEIPFIIGSANHAGLPEAVNHDEESLTEINNAFELFLPNDLAFRGSNEMAQVGERLKRLYFGTENISFQYLNELSLYYTDASYLGPGLRLARALVSAGATVYLYEFSFVGELNKDLVSMEDVPRIGAVKGDVARYLFSQDGKILTEESPEKFVSDTITGLWTSFVHTGVPCSSEFAWRPLEVSSDNSEDWVSINVTVTSRKGLHQDRQRLWTEIYRDYFVDRNSGFRNAYDDFRTVTVLIIVAINQKFL